MLLFTFSYPAFLMANEDMGLATKRVQTAKAECTSLDSGEFDSTEQSIQLFDLTGDGKPEEIVDASQFSCSSAMTLWGGTGGTYLWVIVDNEEYEFLAHQWKVVEMGSNNVLLLGVHSSECSDSVGPCYRALVWQGEFRSIRAHKKV
ncbi:hypothetical protein CGK06_22090 [Vibrio parahaemolyticus]|nr:hypothetical protein CGK06_22090 [Vibrio parahaemolyticus]